MSVFIGIFWWMTLLVILWVLVEMFDELYEWAYWRIYNLLNRW